MSWVKLLDRERTKNNSSHASVHKLKSQIKKFSSEITNIKGLYKSLLDEFNDKSEVNTPYGNVMRFERNG